MKSGEEMFVALKKILFVLNVNMVHLGFVSFMAATLNFKLCFSACARAEYEINGECCPMCAPGNRVYWHCTVDTSTTCIPCPPLTYTDEPSGLESCFPCSVCDAGNGLLVKRICIRSSDTVCGPLEGFYCIQRNKDSCRFAVKHSECLPGKYIKQAGTATADTVCANCTKGTYSNGTFTACRPHSKCETEGLKEIKPGTLSSDVECGSSVPVALIVGVTFGAIGVGFGIAVGIYCKLKPKKQAPDKDKTNDALPIQEVGCKPTSSATSKSEIADSGTSTALLCSKEQSKSHLEQHQSVKLLKIADDTIIIELSGKDRGEKGGIDPVS